MIKIYLITNNINNKNYVGQTTKSLEIRLRRHCWNSEFKKNMPISLAIKKYGKEHFQITEIDTAKTVEAANEKEVYWAKYYNCFSPHGYNLRAGGRKTIYISEETRKKISKANLGRKASKETIERLSNSHKGFRVSEETKKKLSQCFKGKPSHKNTKRGAKEKCCKKYKVLSPLGKELEVIDLKEFCKNNKLCYINMISTQNNNKKYKGWQIIECLGFMYKFLGSRRNPLK